jgi:hypothetical protein
MARILKGLAGLTAIVLAAAVSLPAEPRLDPFGFLAPEIAISQDEQAVLDTGETVVKVAPGRDGYLALSAIVKVNATTEQMMSWATNVEKLQRGKYVPEVGRFSTPPRIDDLRGLTLDPQDLDELRDCRPGDCAIKLSDAEIVHLRTIGERAALDRAFREVLVARATNYMNRGDENASPYRDHKVPVRPGDAFQAVLQRLEFFPRRFDCYAEYLRRFPIVPDRHVQQSFLYWSKETLGMKPIISITHLSAARFDRPELPEAVIVSKQVYATHYRNASITMTLFAGEHTARYLVYVNRSQIDAFRGMLGGFVRRVVERRVRAEAPAVLRDLRRRIESAETAPTHP